MLMIMSGRQIIIKKHGDSAKHYEMRAKQLERELHDREDARLRKEWSKYDW